MLQVIVRSECVILFLYIVMISIVYLCINQCYVSMVEYTELDFSSGGRTHTHMHVYTYQYFSSHCLHVRASAHAHKHTQHSPSYYLERVQLSKLYIAPNFIITKHLKSSNKDICIEKMK